MRQSIAVEFSRLVLRRLFKGLSMLAIAGFAFGGTMAYIASDDSPQRIAQVKAEYETAIQDCMRGIERDAAVMPAELPPAARANPRGFCEDNNYGSSDPRFAYRDFEWMLLSVGMPLVMLGWLLGASAIGAEWANRTMTTTLTWESRRRRVLAAKVVAAAAFSFVWLLTLQGIFAAAMYPAAEFEGTTAGVDLGWWLDIARLALSISAVGAIAAVLGASIATVGRHTAAALGAGFVYLAVVEGLIRAFRPGWVDWLVGDNAALIMIGPEEVNHLSHSQGAALLLLLAYAGALLLVAMAVFKRRDLA